MSSSQDPVVDHAQSTGLRSADQFVGFQLDNQDFAIPIGNVREIVDLSDVVQLPQVEDYVEGVSNLRGAIIPIINLRKLFGLATKSVDGDKRTVVVNVGERTMGCMVDAVSQVLRIPNENIQAVPDAVTSDGADYLLGFAKLEGVLIILLDIERLLDPELLQRTGGIPQL